MSWEPYALAATGVVSALFGQSAFGAGALSLSLPVIDTLEPVCAVVIGATVFGERLASSPVQLGFQLAGGAAAVAGIWMLSRSTIVEAETRDMPAARPAGPEPAVRPGPGGNGRNRKRRRVRRSGDHSHTAGGLPCRSRLTVTQRALAVGRRRGRPADRRLRRRRRAGRCGHAARPPVAAQAAAPGARITVTGTGTVSGTPDQLMLYMGVQTNGSSVSAALQRANRAVSAVTRALARTGVRASDIQTSGLSIQPDYTGNSTVPAGYGVSESVNVTLRTLAGRGHPDQRRRAGPAATPPRWTGSR